MVENKSTIEFTSTQRLKVTVSLKVISYNKIILQLVIHPHVREMCI